MYKRLTYVSTILLLTLFFFFPASETLAARWYEYYLDAERAIEDEEWETAIDQLKQALEKEPKPEKGKRAYGMRKIDYYPYLAVGKAYLALGDVENAHFYCEKSKAEGVAPRKEVNDCLRVPLSDIPTPPESAPEKMKVAVLDFTSAAKNQKELATAVADTLQTKLISLGSFTIIVRGESLQKVMEELAFQQTGVVDEQTAVEVGKQLGARYVITGSLSKPGSFYNVNAILIDVETGTAINAASMNAKQQEDVLEQVPELALKLTGSTLE